MPTTSISEPTLKATSTQTPAPATISTPFSAQNKSDLNRKNELSQKALPNVKISLIRQVIFEIESISAGFETSNAQTRLWMWQDALSELTSTGLYTPISMEDFQTYNVIWNTSQSTDRRLSIHVSGVGIQHVPLWVDIKRPGDPEPNWTYRLKQGFQAAFGVPFGKLYLPIQVVWRVNSPMRYDPHNSLVAILYRTGIVGFTLFCLMTAWALRVFYRTPTVYCAIALGGMVYVLSHALTDNVLENSFKGLWFWSSVGIGLVSLRWTKDLFSESKL